MTELNTLDEQIDSLFTDLEVSVGDLYGDFYEEEIREKFHTAKQQLKTLFTEHSKEVDRLARIDELGRMPVIGKGTFHKDGGFEYEWITAIEQPHVQDRIAQLSKRNKGEDNE